MKSLMKSLIICEADHSERSLRRWSQYEIREVKDEFIAV